MRYVIRLLLFLVIVYPLSPSADYYSPRALALGMGGFSFSYDFSALYNNPALLASFPFSVSGLSYQNRYGDFLDMEKNLDGLIQEWRQKGEDQPLSASGKKYLADLSESGSAIYGFNAKIPAILVKNLGMGVARIQSAYIMPDFSDSPDLSLSDSSPRFRAAGLNYTQYSLGYAMPISQTIFFGTGAHFLTGKLGLNQYTLSDPFFESGLESEDYIKRVIDSAEIKFSKIIFHFGLIWKVAETLDVSLILENFGNPSLHKDEENETDIELTQRYRASFSFRPALDWGFYGDADIRKTPVYPGFDEERQPVSFGIEKGFFQNTAFLRAGLNTDISRKEILGEKSGIVFSFGAGIRVNSILVDAALIMNSNGSVNGLAIAGYYVVN